MSGLSVSRSLMTRLGFSTLNFPPWCILGSQWSSAVQWEEERAHSSWTLNSQEPRKHPEASLDQISDFYFAEVHSRLPHCWEQNKYHLKTDHNEMINPLLLRRVRRHFWNVWGLTVEKQKNKPFETESSTPTSTPGEVPGPREPLLPSVVPISSHGTFHLRETPP